MQFSVIPVNGSRSVVESSGSSGVSRTYWSRLSSCTLKLTVTLGRPHGKYTCRMLSRRKHRYSTNDRKTRGKVQSPLLRFDRNESTVFFHFIKTGKTDADDVAETRFFLSMLIRSINNIKFEKFDHKNCGSIQR